MRVILPILAVGAGLFFMFRAGPVSKATSHSAEVAKAVDHPEEVARTNYLKSPIDRTHAVLDQVKKQRDEDTF